MRRTRRVSTRTVIKTGTILSVKRDKLSSYRDQVLKYNYRIIDSSLTKACIYGVKEAVAAGIKKGVEDFTHRDHLDEGKPLLRARKLHTGLSGVKVDVSEEFQRTYNVLFTKNPILQKYRKVYSRLIIVYTSAYIFVFNSTIIRLVSASGSGPLETLIIAVDYNKMLLNTLLPRSIPSNRTRRRSAIKRRSAIRRRSVIRSNVRSRVPNVGEDYGQ